MKKNPATAPVLNAEAQLTAVIASLWQKHLPEMRARIALLERACGGASAGTLSRGLRMEAAATAHKLSGSLGMYGYREASLCAHELEVLLDTDAVAERDRLLRLTAQLRNALPL